jgi:hypothetical protein
MLLAKWDPRGEEGTSEKNQKDWITKQGNK